MKAPVLRDRFKKRADPLETSYPKHHRSGFLFVETLIALAMLLIATGLTLKMVQAQIDWDHSAIDRLKRQLAVENVAQELSVVPIDELAAEVDRLKPKLQSTIRLQLDSFETGDQTGWHITITDTNHPSLVEHLWRFNEGS